jgi:hypothetical protein
MKKSEISIFKLQFKDESNNLYLHTEKAQEYLDENKLSQIEDKTVAYLKITIQSIIRDIKDISAEEMNKLKNDPICFIQNRMQFGRDCKEHATLALKENAITDAMKVYRKGQGGMKMISRNVKKEASDSVNGIEEEKLQVLFGEFSQVHISLMLNQGLCHWKLKEWEKMKQVNEDILMNYDNSNVKARYRFALA